MSIVSQVSTLVNDAVKDAIGKNADITQLDTTDVVTLGQVIDAYDAYDLWYGALVNRIIKTLYFVRTYEANPRSILRDEHDYGAFIQKVYTEMPEAVDNSEWGIPTIDTSNNSRTYKQHSPYDVDTTIGVKALIYGKQGTWTIEFIRPSEQIKTAFIGDSEMLAFVGMLCMTAENAMKLEEERLIATAVNTSMAACIAAGKARNLLEEYNTLEGTQLTVAKALTDAGFLRYASKEIGRTVDNMQSMSGVFNINGYTTFTPKSELIVEMNSEFAKASDMYLQSDTFHKELVALPRYTSVPYWQSSGTDFSFAKTSEIKIKNAEISGLGENTDGIVNQSGIICFLRDTENCAAYFNRMRTWELPNPRDGIVIHGEKARKGYAVDKNANAYVFYIA